MGALVGNIGNPVYFSNMRPLVNWAQQAGNGNGNRALNATSISELAGWQAGYFNSNGDLNSGSAISGVTDISISLFTPPPFIGTYPPGPSSAMFMGTVSSNVLTVTLAAGTIKSGDQVVGPGLQGTVYNIQPFGSGGTSGAGGNGTYQLSNTATVSVAVAMTSYTYWWTGLSLTVKWSGSATAVALAGTAFTGTGGSFPTCTSSPCTLTLGYNPLNVALVFSFPSAAASPPTQIQVFETQYATQMADCAAGTNLFHCWAPDWVAQNGPIGIKRYMDVFTTNSTGITDPLNQYADQNYSHLGNACGGFLVGNGSIASTTLTMLIQGGAVTPGLLLTDTAGLVVPGTHITSGTGGTNSTYSLDTSNTIPSGTAAFTTTSGSAVLTVTGTPSATISPFFSISDGGVLISTNTQANGTVILSQLSGTTGGAGTYQMSRNALGAGSGTLTFSDVFLASAPTSGWNGQGGPKCGIHPSLLVALANATNTAIHWNLSPFITNAGMTNLDTYLSANLKNGLWTVYELCNEFFNFSGGFNCFGIGNLSGITAIGSGTNAFGWAGYRMAQLMNIVRGIRGPSNRSNWRGEVSSQAVSQTSAASFFIAGAQQWIAANAPTLTIKDLFDDTIIALYPSDFTTSVNITAVTTGATTTVTLSGNTTGSGQTIANGQKRRLFFASASGMSLYNNADVTLANVSGNTFQFSDFPTTGSTFTNSGANWLSPPGFFDMTDASTACYVNAGATINGGSITGNNLTFSSATGTVRPGQTLSGVTGIPANDYIIAGSGLSWTLAQGVLGTITGTMTASPCSTNYQFFAYEYSKSLISGNNDYGYSLNTSASNVFPSVTAVQQLYANSYGLQLHNYEGGPQIVTGGFFAASGSTANAIVEDFQMNYFYDSSDLDPTYSPAAMVATVYNAMSSVNSNWPAHYTISNGLGTFNAWPYPGAETAMWQQLQFENLNPFVDHTTPTSATCTLAGSGGLPGNGSTVTSFSANIGTTPSPFIAVIVGQNGGTFGTPTVAVGTGGGAVALTQLYTNSNSGVTSAMYTGVATGLSGTQTVTVTFNAGSTFRPRPVFAFTTANLNSQSVLSQASTGQVPQILNYTEGGCIIAGGISPSTATGWGASTGAATLNSSTPGQAPNPTSYLNYTVGGGIQGSAATLVWPFSSSLFQVNNGSTTDGLVAIEVR